MEKKLVDELKLAIEEIKQRRIYLSDFPALSGEQDDCGRFNRAIAETPVGGELVIPDGYYFVDSLKIQKNISLIFQGNATLESTAPNREILRIEGSRDERNYVLAQPLKRGDRKLFLTVTSTLKKGDLIILTDDTTRRADKQADMNTEIHEIETVINFNKNLVENSSLATDSDGDGVADQFISYGHQRLDDVFSVSQAAQAQMIRLPQTAGESRVGLVQTIPVSSHERYTFQIEAKVAKRAGDFEAGCYLMWYNRQAKLVSKEHVADFVQGEWSQISLCNICPPQGAVFCKIHLEAEQETTGSFGTVLFRNVKMQLASTCIILRDFVRLPKKVSKNGVNLYQVHPLQNIMIKNFRYVMKEGSDWGNGLTLRFVKGALVEGIQGYRGAGSGIQVQKSIHVIVRDFCFISPQKVGSGQGYGVQFYGGCSGVVIKDGYTLDCRHSVDLDSTYDAHVENVFDYNAQGAAFVMSHNGCCSDITFRGCQTLHAIGSGFVADSQGFTDRRECIFHNFRVIDCTAVIKNRATAAVYWYSPCKHAIVRDCYLAFDHGGLPGIDLGNAGVRLYPAQSEALVSGCNITGFRRGIALQAGERVQLENDQSQITVRDTQIKQCKTAILCYQGKGRRLSIYNLDCQQIASSFLELNGQGTFSELIIDGLSLRQSPSCQFINTPEKISSTESPDGLKGYINNLRSDHSPALIAQPNWQLTTNHLYMCGDGTSVLLEGTGGSSGAEPLPDGWVEGQRLTLLISSGTWIVRRGSNMVYAGGVPAITLDKNRYSLSLMWRNGKWIELSS